MKKRFTYLAMMLIATACMTSCDKDDKFEEETKTVEYKYNLVACQEVFYSIQRDGGNNVFKFMKISLDSAAVQSETSTISTAAIGFETFVPAADSTFDILYFNEKAIVDSTSGTTSANYKGTPGIALGAKTSIMTFEEKGDDGFVKACALSSETLISGEYTQESSTALPLSAQRVFYDDVPYLGIKSEVTEIYDTQFYIGNVFQNSANDRLPDDQIVYLLKTEHGAKIRFYAFMVYKFQNGTDTSSDPDTDKRYMSIRYKLLMEGEPESL